jgi:hypothetical protein
MKHPTLYIIGLVCWILSLLVPTAIIVLAVFLQGWDPSGEGSRQLYLAAGVVFITFFIPGSLLLIKSSKSPKK